ncbi:DNA/RNA non-specific endonuclease [Fangia hongkongensis]|uniref:DNA/RNA non-specific endonuclease n=1 Tax=Fangia hongkongensis TaxID=270495 RepID=UPI000373C439|nr:DNA/RNA non-specific endonuclease [Fangia hongkongensis]MBK2126087.1 DNA/RNA non-specific endonuclease [Fangia hongkongensis]
MKASLKSIFLCVLLSISFLVSQTAYSFSLASPPVSKSYCHGFLLYGNPKGQINQYLCREGYLVGYNYTTKQPTWVAYHLSANSVSHTIKRHDVFQPDLEVPKTYRAELSDYRKSGYDRGHLAPYAAMDFDKTSAKQSFYLSNMSPQKPQLNRKGWAELEKDVRFWARMYQEVYVYTGPIFKNSKSHKSIGKNKIYVPEYFFKIIYAPKQHKDIAFIMPNANVSKKNVANYRVSVKEIEQRTGLHFFNNLPESQSAALKTTVSPMWRVSYH